MTRLSIVCAAVLALVACDKPTPESCRKALINIQHLEGTDNLNTAGSLESEVRRCRGGSSKEAVECATKAASLEELDKCAFRKVRDRPATGSGSSSGSGSAGSAAK